MRLKQTGILYFPYVERLGLFLLRFLNADLSTYDNTYLKETKKIYDTLQEQLLYIQEQITYAFNYIYNINENEELKSFTHSQIYAYIYGKYS